MSKLIEFTIKDGEVTMDLKGFNGQGCTALADKFSSLGNVNKSVLKPEIHNTEESSNTITAKA
jgi:hypothetical protein